MAPDLHLYSELIVVARRTRWLMKSLYDVLCTILRNFSFKITGSHFKVGQKSERDFSALSVAEVGQITVASTNIASSASQRRRNAPIGLILSTS